LITASQFAPPDDMLRLVGSQLQLFSFGASSLHFGDGAR
jgi:hypothetical protein